MTATIVIVLAIAVLVFLVVISKKRENEKQTAFVCEHCSEQDCICHEADIRENGRK